MLLQGYFHLACIIMDGCSTDGTVDIIRAYDRWITSRVSEPDRGRARAINKGFARATGEALVWLSSDDVCEPGAPLVAGQTSLDHPGTIMACQVMSLCPAPTQERLVKRRDATLVRFASFWEGGVWHQPGLFFPASGCSAVGPLDESLRYAMDFDLLCRLPTRFPLTDSDCLLNAFRIHPSSKTPGRPVSASCWRMPSLLSATGTSSPRRIE